MHAASCYIGPCYNGTQLYMHIYILSMNGLPQTCAEPSISCQVHIVYIQKNNISASQYNELQYIWKYKCTTGVENWLYYKQHSANLRDLIAATWPNLIQMIDFSAHVTLMVASKNNTTPLLYYIKLCASFEIHRWIQTEVTVRKR